MDAHSALAARAGPFLAHSSTLQRVPVDAVQMGKMRVSTAGITAVICTKDVPFIIAADGDGSIHMLTSRGHLAPYQHVFSFSNLHIIPEIYDPEGEHPQLHVAAVHALGHDPRTVPSLPPVLHCVIYVCRRRTVFYPSAGHVRSGGRVNCC